MPACTKCSTNASTINDHMSPVQQLSWGIISYYILAWLNLEANKHSTCGLPYKYAITTPTVRPLISPCTLTKADQTKYLVSGNPSTSAGHRSVSQYVCALYAADTGSHIPLTSYIYIIHSIVSPTHTHDIVLRSF